MIITIKDVMAMSGRSNALTALREGNPQAARSPGSGGRESRPGAARLKKVKPRRARPVTAGESAPEIRSIV